MTQIIAFVTDTCPHCVNAKKFLKENGYDFVERNVNKDPEALKAFQNLKLTGVPAFLVGEQLVVGFDANKIESLLDYFIKPCPNCGKKYKFPKHKGKLRVTCKACTTQFEIESL